MKKKYISLLLGLTLSLSLVVTANADNIKPGWKNDNGTWYFLTREGNYKTGWFRDGGDWYYLQSNGAMKTGWLQDNGKWYYLNSNGVMAHDTTVGGYYLAHTGEWTTNVPASANSSEWTCPQIKSSATSDVSAGFKTLHDELGFGYSSGWAGYSTYMDNPTYVTPTALSVTKYNKQLHNAEIMIQIRQWANDSNIKNSYRVKPMAQQLFKFYFPNASDTMFNDVNTLFEGSDADGYALLDHIVTIGDRQVYFTSPERQGLMIWISSPGESITQ